MNIQTHLPRCQFLIPTENSNVGRVKISEQNLAVFSTQRVSTKNIIEYVIDFSILFS
jgi:hypothetical protein